MYSLDINFLRDRGLDAESRTQASPQKAQASPTANLPIIIGAAVMIALPAMAFGALKVVEGNKSTAEQKIKDIDGEIASLGAKNQEVQQVKDQISAIETEAKSIVNVFNQIKPWSAILQELSDRTPPGVGIESIKQTSSAGEDGNPIMQLSLEGTARSYEDVNDFMLFLQRSKFFRSEKTKLSGASLIDYQIEWEKEPPKEIEVNIPKIVKYSITTELNGIPVAELIKELNSKGAVGFVTRLQTLERKGAI